jgi:flagellar biosynthesis/type III secretory pathway protein FliH
MLAVGAFAVVAILETSDVASAQWNNRNQKQQEKIYKQQQKIQRQQEKINRQSYNNQYRVYRNGSYYNTDNRGAELLRQAVNRGYQQGLMAGRTDRANRRGSGWGNSNVYRNGNYGYQSYVDSSQYRYYFQQGFERGYQDGYNSRYQYGSSNNGTFNILGSILSGILNIQSY